jgi:deoxyribodipyrimidine photo-lyase
VPSTAIVWFRRDLRVHDHPALTRAHREHDRVVPLFVLDERLLGGGRFSSAKREAFLLGCLHDLRESLRARGAELFVRAGRPERVLRQMVEQTRAEALYFASDASPFAMARDRRVEDAVPCRVIRTPGNFIADINAVKDYRVFTPFQRAHAELPRREVHGAPRALRVPSGLSAGRIPGARETDIPAGERPARERARRWLADGIHGYRSGQAALLTGPTSQLSPYLHFGCISARELEERGAGTPSWTRQLVWRDFYGHVLLRNPGNARRALKPEFENLEWSDDGDALAAWKEGRTGFPVVDAGMRQLARTGWMPNRARLIAASFLTKDLHLDWRLGEAHFMEHLLDGDEANNNGNWQWIASVGVDPQPFYKRLYNPALQQQRHDPRGEYARRWIAELDTPAYPQPIVDHAVERRRAIERYAAVT